MKLMRRRTRLLIVVAIGIVGAAIAGVSSSDVRAASLVLLAAGIVLGEILVLRLEDGTGVPLSYAVMLVLIRSFTLPVVMTTVVLAEAVAFFATVGQRSTKRRLFAIVMRSATAVAAIGAYQVAKALIGPGESTATLLLSLTCVMVVVVAVHELFRSVMRVPTSLGARGRTAWLAVASSGMLMAVGYGGVDGGANVGIWGPMLFSIPLLAAWYAFDRLESASRTRRQTIEALSLAPELGGLVLEGHASRVASTALSIGRELGLSADELQHLETAALLHHLGEVILDDPAHAGVPTTPEEVAAVTAGMLREIAPLAAAGDIVAGERSSHHSAGRSRVPAYHLASQVLKVVGAFDDLTAGEGVRTGSAIETLYADPGYVYDSRVLDALERVLLTGSPAAV